MIFDYNANKFHIDATSYAPNYESGIRWKAVGGRWHHIDKGSGTDHYSSFITVEDDYEKIHTFHEFLVDLAVRGVSFLVQCNEVERIFGSEFSYADEYTCRVAVDMPPYTSEAPDGSIIGRLEFTLYSITEMEQRWIPSPLSLPVMPVTHVERVPAIITRDVITEQGWRQVTSDWRNKVLTIRYTSNTADIAQAKKYLISRRGASFNLSNLGDFFYYTYGQTNIQVKFFDITESEPFDSLGLTSSIDVTYLVES